MAEFQDQEFAAALGLSAAVADRFQIYSRLLRDWQKKINLVAPSTLDSLWRRHFLDSYQLNEIAGAWSNWVDLGSGAGFPGVVIALAQTDRSRIVHLIESDKRKASFLREVSRETGAAVEIHVSRIEQALPALCKAVTFDVVSARALAPMNRLIALARPALEQGALGLFLKGKGLNGELTDLPSNIRFDMRIAESRSDADGKIVIIKRYSSQANSV